MPAGKLTINPPGHSSPQPNTTLPEDDPNNAASTPPNTNKGITSPIAPAWSPLTPVFAPLDSLPNTTSPTTNRNIAPATYIPSPAPQPFSSTDSTDAIALRAAISSLQFQRKKATEDLRTLERLRSRAVEDPEGFRGELVAGRVGEGKSKALGEWRSILEESGEREDEDGNDDVEMKDEEEDDEEEEEEDHDDADFSRIPAPQNVVRMPYINWEKYHISGPALEKLHEQQRRWPGSTFDYTGAAGGNAGREFAVAAPWSPWLDSVAGAEGGDGRKDSLGWMGTPVGGSVSEHPMETRRGGSRQVQ